MARAWERLAASGRNRTITEAVARNVVSQIVEQATGSALQFYTCKAWLAGKVGTTATGTLTRYKQVLELGPRMDGSRKAEEARFVAHQ
jgi:hypothetical protein